MANTEYNNCRIWKDIPGFEGLYLISTTGMVYSVRRRKVLKPDNSRGYMVVTLQRDGIRRRYGVHRLVALSYIPNPNNLPVVNHKDEDKTNNDVSNLEWCTTSYNNNYGSRTERSTATQINNAFLRKDVRPVICIDTNIRYLSTKDAERKTGVYHSHISRCCSGERKTAGGKRWRYDI